MNFSFITVVNFFRKFNLDVLILYIILVIAFFFPIKDHVIGAADSYNQFLPLRVFYSQALKSGDFPLWYPYQALGLPFLGIVQGGGLYPFNLILYKFFDPYWAYNFSIYLHFVLAQFFGFLYADYVYRKVGIGRVFAIISGFLFGLSGFIVSHVDFVPLQNSIPYLPLSLLFLNLIVDNWGRRNFVWFLGLSISLGYQFLAGYPQAWLYSFIFLLLFVIYNNYRLFWVPFLSFLVSFPIVFLFAYEILRLSSLSIRNYINFETYNQGCLPVYSLLNQIVPFIFGGSVSNPVYYGPPTGTISFEFISYLSIFALPLTVFGFLKIWGKVELRKVLGVFVILGVIVFIFALGKYNLILHYLMFDIPFYSKVRVVARHLMELNFIQSIVIPIALFYILNSLREFYKFLRVSFWVYLVVMFVSMGFLVNSEVSRNISKLNVNSVDLYFPLLFGLMFLFVFVFYYFVGKKFVSRNEIGFIVLCIFFWESFFVFYNISPSYTGNWWGKRENIKSYIDYVGKLDKDYRLCYFNGFPLIFPGVSGVRMLNYYEPVIPFEFVKLFNIWMNGSFIYPNDYFFIINNSILSSFSVKYLFLNNEFNQKYFRFMEIKNLNSVNIDFLRKEILSYEVNNFIEVFNLSKDIKIDIINNTFILKSGSKLIYGFKNSLFNKLVLVCFRAKVNRNSFFYKYRKLIFNISDGIGIEIKDSSNNSLGYYFVNDYYMNEWAYFVVPFILDFNSNDDFIDLYLNIYPLNSFGRIYEIRDLEIYALPLKVPNFKDNFIKNAYIYSDSFMGCDLYINPNALPIVFSASRVKFVENMDEFKYIFSVHGLELGDVVLLNRDKEILKDKNIRKAEVNIIRQGSNFIELYYKSDGYSIIVFNDMFFPGWKASLDGKDLEIFRANGLCKAVLVGKGEGIIKFYYQPFSPFLLNLNIFFIFIYLVLFFIFFLLQQNAVCSKFRINH